MAAITSAAIGVAASGYQIYQGEQQKKKAKAAMNQYERADLENAFENMQVSTIGSDFVRDEMLRGSASLVNAMQQGGSRMVTAGLPRVQSMLTQSGNEARNYLDSQVKEREQLVARDNTQIRNIRENRDMQNLQAISSQYQAGQQDSFSGMLGGMRSLSALGNELEFGANNQPSVVNQNTGEPVTFGNTEVTPTPYNFQPSQAPSIPNTVNYPVGPGFQNPYMQYDPYWGVTSSNFINKNLFE